MVAAATWKLHQWSPKLLMAAHILSFTIILSANIVNNGSKVSATIDMLI